MSSVGPVLAGEGVEGDQVLLGFFEQPADPRRDWLQAGDHVGDAFAVLVAILGVEDLPERGGDEVALVATAVHDDVSQEVNSAALPRAAEDAGDRCLGSFVLVADSEAHPVETSLL